MVLLHCVSVCSCDAFVCQCAHSILLCVCVLTPCSALDEDDGENPEVAEMPVNLDIEVEAVPLEEHEREQLRTDTR